MTLEETIKEKLVKAFQPKELIIKNNSAAHHNHASSPQTGQSHFSIEITSPLFSNKSRVEAQRMVYKVLEEELKISIHALALKVSSN